jgi:hypothetical protein
MPLAFAVVCEAPPDHATACGLADRVFCDEVEWIEEEGLHDYRTWRGIEDHSSHLLWRDVPELAKAASIRAHGHFDGEPGAPDAHAARRALLLLKHLGGKLDGVLLIRDDDRQTERRKGLQQARQATKLTIPVVIGLAHPKRECWVLAGFDPLNTDEKESLEEVIGQLGFDPRTKAEGLTAIHDPDLRSAKRVLALLTNGERDREAACWRTARLALLAERGRNSGLADYLREIRTHFLPLLK